MIQGRQGLPSDPWRVLPQPPQAALRGAPDWYALLRYAVLAPSCHNSQPWRWRATGQALELWLDRRRALPVADPQGREMVISCGVSLMFLRLVIRVCGREDVVEVQPNRDFHDLLARVSVGGPRPALVNERLMFGAITRRRTERGPFLRRPVPGWLADAMARAAAGPGVRWHALRGASRARLAELVAEGDQVQGGDPAFRRELARWISANGGPRLDGMPGYFRGLGRMAARYGPMIVQRCNWGAWQGRQDRGLVLNAPLVGVLLGSSDDVPGWLAAGEGLARLLLRAAVEGIGAGYLNAVVQVAELRQHLQALLMTPDFPQVVLRLGYAELREPAPRRPVDSVLAG